MNAYKILNPKTWIKERYEGIGASEIAILCLKTAYKTPLELYEEKVNKKDAPVSEETQKLFTAGKAQEPVTLYNFLKKEIIN